MDVVGELLDQSLLVSQLREGQPRFYMLVSVKAYAQEKREEMEKQDTPGTGLASLRRRHRSFFCQLGDVNFQMSLLTHGGEARRRALHHELENLCYAAQVEARISREQLDDACACGLAATVIYESTGPYAQGLRILTALLSQPLSSLSRCRTAAVFLSPRLVIHSYLYAEE